MSLCSRNYRNLVACGTAAFAFALLAWALRSSGYYPICPNDEANWIGIAHQLDAGVHWPVSGPAFINTVRAISETLQFSQCAGNRHFIHFNFLHYNYSTVLDAENDMHQKSFSLSMTNLVVLVV